MSQAVTTISVIGGGAVSDEMFALAEDVGQEIAKRGAVVVCGGLEGIMKAVCKGAYEAGGLTIGILPGATRAEANPYVQIPVVTGIGYARNVAVVRSGQAVIAIDGSYGTLTEIAYALQAGIPVVGLHTWTMAINRETDDRIIRAESAADAVGKALDAIK